MVQFTTTRCVCVDILRWEHASIQLPRHSTWWVEHLSPLPPPKQNTSLGKKMAKGISVTSHQHHYYSILHVQTFGKLKTAFTSALSYGNNKHVDNSVSVTWTGTYKSSSDCSSSIQSAKHLVHGCSVLIHIQTKHDCWNAICSEAQKLSDSSRSCCWLQ